MFFKLMVLTLVVGLGGGCAGVRQQRTQTTVRDTRTATVPPATDKDGGGVVASASSEMESGTAGRPSAVMAPTPPRRQVEAVAASAQPPRAPVTPVESTTTREDTPPSRVADAAALSGVAATPTPATSNDSRIVPARVPSVDILDSALAPLTLTAEDTGKTVIMPLGETLWLRLNERILPEHVWDLENVDESVLLPTASLKVDDNDAPAATGGYRLIQFKALARGTTTLQLSYLKPHEKVAPPPIAMQIEVEVK